MTSYFLDSSALVKRYITEQGSKWIRSLTLPRARNIIFIAPVTQLEVVSSLARRWREGTISRALFDRSRMLFARHTSRQYTVITFDSALAGIAEDLILKYPLRAYDSVQLAAAVQAQLKMPNKDKITFVCADNRLREAATAENLDTINPNEQP